MILLAILLVISVVCLLILGGMLAADDEFTPVTVVACFALISGSLLIIVVAPNQLGTGRVAEHVEGYNRILEEGVAYEVTTSSATTAEYYAGFGEPRLVPKGTPVQVLLLRQYGTEQYFAIRVEGEVPPSPFVLVDGKPVKIEP